MTTTKRSSLAVVLGCLVTAGAALAQDGHIGSGFGPVDSAMGGAGTAAAGGSLGTIAWNPAGTHEFEAVRLETGMSLFQGRPDLDVRIASGGGTTLPYSSDEARIFRGSVGLVVRPEGAPIAFHFASGSFGGMEVNYKVPSTGETTLESQYTVSRTSLGLSVRLGSDLSLGFSVIGGEAVYDSTSVPFVAPEDADGDGIATYPTPTDDARAFGMGVQVGLQVRLSETVSAGLSYASPIWFGDFEIPVLDEAGDPGTARFNLDVPAFLSAGVAVKAAPGTVLALDVRRFFYSDADGFDRGGWASDGSLNGFGWRDIWVVGAGLQQDLGYGLVLRLGYHYSQNPVGSEETYTSLPLPALVRHTASAGFAVPLGGQVVLNLGYSYGFSGSGTGPYVDPLSGASSSVSFANSFQGSMYMLGLAYQL